MFSVLCAGSTAVLSIRLTHSASVPEKFLRSAGLFSANMGAFLHLPLLRSIL
jgi:hypothetical protein